MVRRFYRDLGQCAITDKSAIDLTI